MGWGSGKKLSSDVDMLSRGGWDPLGKPGKRTEDVGKEGAGVQDLEVEVIQREAPQ